MVVHTCEYAKNHRILHFKWVNYMISDLYLNEAVKAKNTVRGQFGHPHARLSIFLVSKKLSLVLCMHRLSQTDGQGLTLVAISKSKEGIPKIQLSFCYLLLLSEVAEERL